MLITAAGWAGHLVRPAKELDIPRAIDTGAVTFDSVSPDGQFHLLCAGYWEPDPDETFSNGKPFFAFTSTIGFWPANLTFSAKAVTEDERHIVLSGMELNETWWAEDSSYVVFSACHENGHSPWNRPMFILGTRNGDLHPVEALTGPIVRDAIVLSGGELTVAAGGHDPDGSVDFEHPVSKTVKVKDVLAVKPVGTTPLWRSPFKAQGK